jgi:hypothetical protein
MIKIGIDPGSSNGAICATDDVGNWKILHIPKSTQHDISKFFKELALLREKGSQMCCAVERQIAFPGQNVASTGRQMEHYGMLKGMLIAYDIPFSTPTPQKWLKLYSMKKKPGEEKGPWKRRLRDLAEQLEPDLKIINDTADAILITRVADKLM